MKTLLVLIDHSYSAFNAARYALSFAGTFENCKVILYNSFNYLADSASEAAYVTAGFDSMKQESKERMADLQISLEPFRKPGTLIEAISDERRLITAVSELSRKHNVDVIMAGSKNRSAVGMLLIGSRILDLINHIDLPVLVIPSACIYEPVSNAVLTTDLLEVDKLPQNLIKKFIADYRCRLLVLNVDPHDREQSDIEKIMGIEKLHELLDPSRPDYHYTSNSDISKGIRDFCDAQHAGLTILIHKERSFMHKVFYKSIEQEMTMHSHVPVLILKQVE
jgi:nucleotide-binding universal stress UspA family protein